MGGLVDLVGVPRRRHEVARVWRWVRFRGAGGPALSGFLITAGAGRQGFEVWVGILLGLGWLMGRGSEWDERSRRARSFRSGTDPDVTPAVHFRRVSRIQPTMGQARLPRVEDPSRQPTRRY